MNENGSSSVEIEVPFHDVDALGIVWHGHYLKYLEIARTALLRSRSLDATDLVAMGLRLLLVDSHCRHTGSLRYGDRARVRAWLKDIDHRICIAYEVTNLTTAKRAARARTVLVTTDAQGQMLYETPAEVVRRLLA